MNTEGNGHRPSTFIVSSSGLQENVIVPTGICMVGHDGARCRHVLYLMYNLSME